MLPIFGRSVITLVVEALDRFPNIEVKFETSSNRVRPERCCMVADRSPSLQ